MSDTTNNGSATGSLTSGDHQSIWTESVIAKEYPALSESIKTDVVVVGGGMAGLMTAYGLLTAGKQVVVVEDGVIGSGETGRTTAHLTAALDDRYYQLEKLFGKQDMRLAASSHQQAINFIEHIVETESIDCNFKRVDGYLFQHPSDLPKNLEKEFAAASEAGLEVEVVEQMPGIKMQGPAILFKNQAQFHPLKFLHGLADAIKRKGGQIFTGTHAKVINRNGIATADNFLVEADYVVVATNSPVNNKVVMHTKQLNFRSYVVAFSVPKNSLPSVLWWDTGDFKANKDVPPYHYVRIESFSETEDLLIVGGEDHPVGLTEQGNVPETGRYAVLEQWARQYFDVGPVVAKWSGEIREPADCLAYIGRNPLDEENIFIVTGDSGNGMTHGAIAGLLIPGLITEGDHPWRRIYSPSRMKLGAAGILLREFTSSMFQYMKHKPKTEKGLTIDEIHPGEAHVIALDGKKYGVFRDFQDQLHLVSITCTHLGCTLSWNGDERSWDCPCHGSRFTHEGKVINGPANIDLSHHMENMNEFMLHLRQQELT